MLNNILLDLQEKGTKTILKYQYQRVPIKYWIWYKVSFVVGSSKDVNNP